MGVLFNIDNALALKHEEEELWREKCMMMDRKFELTKKQISQKKEN